MGKLSDDAQLVEQIENELRAMAQHVEFAGQEYRQWFYFTNEAEYKTARRILDIVDAAVEAMTVSNNNGENTHG